MTHSAIMSVRITGNSDDAVKAFQKATTKAAAFGSFMGGAALKGVTALWDKVSSFGSAVMDMSDSTDKFVSTMNFAGIDTANVEKASKAARDYADRTVYDLSTIQNTTAQLAANGIKDYTGLTEAAGNLNAVAGGNADTFGSVAMVLTQTAGAGKLTTENWNQLADAIPGASGKLQEAMKANGAYTGNFRDAMEKGEISADEFNQAIMQLGMSDVAKEAASSTKTMEGALGNLEAAITGGLTDAFNLIKPAVTGALTEAGDRISQFSQTATNGLKSFIQGVSDTGAFQSLSGMVSGIGGALSSLGGAFSSIAATIAPGLQGLSDAGGIGTAVGEAFTGAAVIIQALADKLTQGQRERGTHQRRANSHRRRFRSVQGGKRHQRRGIRVAGLQPGVHRRVNRTMGVERGHERQPDNDRGHRHRRAGGSVGVVLHPDRNRTADMEPVHRVPGQLREQHNRVLPVVAGPYRRVLPERGGRGEEHLEQCCGLVQWIAGPYPQRPG